MPQRYAGKARGRLAAGTAIVGLVLAGGCGDSTGRPTPNGLNVLFVVIDTLRADHLGCYGHERPTTPSLDELAAGAVVFERAYSAAPWTKPSVASIFTSLHATQHLVLEEGSRNQLAPGLTTLAERLADVGYRTGAVSENPHVQPKTGFDQGFQDFHGLRGYQADAGEAVRWAREWLAKADERPFFLYVHVLDPHGPYTPKGDHVEGFLSGLATDEELVREGKVGKMLDGEALTVELDADDLAYLTALYDAELRGVDGLLGRLFEALDELGVRERTVVVLSSDHGEELLDHGTLKHGYHLYEESLRVPLLIDAPGIPPRREEHAFAHHVDLTPTILDLLDIPLEGPLHGRSLRGVLEGEEQPERALVHASSWRDIERFAVREGRWKLIVHADQERVELYDMDADPGEKRDLAADQPALVERLRALYAEATRPVEGLGPIDATGESDAEIDEALIELGYSGIEEEDEHDHGGGERSGKKRGGKRRGGDAPGEGDGQEE